MLNFSPNQIAKCQTKTAYQTPEVAKRCAMTARLRYATDFRHYRCDVCGKYHLTTDRRKAAIKAALVGGVK